jgi:16S rRNA (uracil1498-N3)-methyltransferase
MSPPPRLFVEADLVAGGTVSFAEEHTNYLTRVLRKDRGDFVRVFNGRDGEWEGALTAVGRRNADIELLRQIRPQVGVPDVWLLFAPLKKARTDFVIEKATELGVARILPVMTERTQSERVRADRLRAIAIEAAEQTERVDVPEIEDGEALAKVLDGWDPGRRLVFADEALAGVADAAALARLTALEPGPCALLIGPEGGFTPREQAWLTGLPQTITVSLGPRVLRAETAVIALLTLWQACQGDLGQATRGDLG